MVCESCGCSVADDEKFCYNCGAALNRSLVIQQSGTMAKKVTERPVFEGNGVKCEFCETVNPVGASECVICGNKLNHPDYSDAFYYRKRDNARRNDKTIPILVISIIVLLTLIISVFAVFYFSGPSSDKNKHGEEIYDKSSEKSKDKEEDKSVDEDSELSSEDLVETVAVADIEFDSVYATSYIQEGIEDKYGKMNYYYPKNVIDGDDATCWCTKRADDENPVITLECDEQEISGIRFSDGYFKSEEYYLRNRRITEVKVSYSGGYEIYTCENEKFGILHNVEFDEPVETSFISIEILDSVPGNSKNDDDYCISTIEAY